TNAPRPDSAHDRDAKGRSSHWSRQVFSLTNASPANAAKVLQDRQFYFDSSRFTTNFSARGITSNVTGSLPMSSPSALNHMPGVDSTRTRLARSKITAE